MGVFISKGGIKCLTTCSRGTVHPSSRRNSGWSCCLIVGTTARVLSDGKGRACRLERSLLVPLCASLIPTTSRQNFLWYAVRMRAQGRLLAFTGTECTHCRRMEPVVAEVERQTRKHIQRLEVWHDLANAAVMRQYADALRVACGGLLGVPAFYNEETGTALCGEVDFDTLSAWATGNTREAR